MDSSLSALADSKTISLRAATSASSRYRVQPPTPKPVDVDGTASAEDQIPTQTKAELIEKRLAAAAMKTAIEELPLAPFTSNPVEDTLHAEIVVGAEAASVATAPVRNATEAVDIPLCPRCNGKLVNPQDLGWCPRCRYCRSLELEHTATHIIGEPKTGKASPLGILEMIDFVRKLQPWVYVLSTGVIAIVALSLMANAVLLYEGSFVRALISAVTYVASFLTILFVNIWTISLFAHKDDQMGARDVFLCARLWWVICKNLPAMRRQLYLIVWALTALLCALIIIRGNDYWLLSWEEQALVDKANQAARDNENTKRQINDGDLEESVTDFAKSQSLSEEAGGGFGARKKARSRLAKSKKLASEKLLPSGLRLARCMVVGFNASNGRVSGLVLASQEESGAKYVGVVQEGWTPKQATLLLAQLTPYAQAECPIAGVPVRARWVEPDIYCSVTFADLNNQSLLESPRFKELHVSTTRGIIIGYTVDERDQLQALVVASVLGTRIRYAGTVSRGITELSGADLQKQLEPLVQAGSPIPGLELNAHWVQPKVYCEISHEGFDDNYQFLNPVYRGFVRGD